MLFEPAPPSGTRYELEEGEVSGGANAGSRHVGSMQNIGAAVAIEVDGGSKGGEFELTVGFAAGGGANCALLVNGIKQTDLLFPSSGGWGEYKSVKLSIRLEPGANKLEFRSQQKSGVNLDYVDLKRLK